MLDVPDSTSTCASFRYTKWRLLIIPDLKLLPQPPSAQKMAVLWAGGATIDYRDNTLVRIPGYEEAT